MNKWLDIFRCKKQDTVQIRDNFERTGLIWESEVNDEMPILRENWMEVQACYQAYLTECEIGARIERAKKWQNVYTNLSMISESLHIS